MILLFEHFTYPVRIFDMINILDFTIIHSRQYTGPIITSYAKEPNFKSILFNDFKLITLSKIFLIRNIFQVTQKPIEISFILKFYNMLIFIIKLMITKTCCINFKCIQTMNHLPTLLYC